MVETPGTAPGSDMLIIRPFMSIVILFNQNNILIITLFHENTMNI